MSSVARSPGLCSSSVEAGLSTLFRGIAGSLPRRISSCRRVWDLLKKDENEDLREDDDEVGDGVGGYGVRKVLGRECWRWKDDVVLITLLTPIGELTWIWKEPSKVGGGGGIVVSIRRIGRLPSGAFSVVGLFNASIAAANASTGDGSMTKAVCGKVGGSLLLRFNLKRDFTFSFTFSFFVPLFCLIISLLSSLVRFQMKPIWPPRRRDWWCYVIHGRWGISNCKCRSDAALRGRDDSVIICTFASKEQSSSHLFSPLYSYYMPCNTMISIIMLLDCALKDTRQMNWKVSWHCCRSNSHSILSGKGIIGFGTTVVLWAQSQVGPPSGPKDPSMAIRLSRIRSSWNIFQFSNRFIKPIQCRLYTAQPSANEQVKEELNAQAELAAKAKVLSPYHKVSFDERKVRIPWQDGKTSSL